MNYETLHCDLSEHILTVTLNRPDVRALAIPGVSSMEPRSAPTHHPEVVQALDQQQRSINQLWGEEILASVTRCKARLHRAGPSYVHIAHVATRIERPARLRP